MEFDDSLLDLHLALYTNRSHDDCSRRAPIVYLLFMVKRSTAHVFFYHTTHTTTEERRVDKHVLLL